MNVSMNMNMNNNMNCSPLNNMNNNMNCAPLNNINYFPLNNNILNNNMNMNMNNNILNNNMNINNNMLYNNMNINNNMNNNMLNNGMNMYYMNNNNMNNMMNNNNMNNNINKNITINNMNNNMMNNNKINESINNISSEMKDYYSNKLYQIDFNILEEQNKAYYEIKKKLTKYIENYDNCINYNNKIKTKYLEAPNKIENYNLLTQMKESIEQKYNSNLKEINELKCEIEDIIRSCINNLKLVNNYLIAFNKKYYTHFNGNEKRLISCEINELMDMDEQKFQDLCKINFKNLEELGIYGRKNSITNIDCLSEALFFNLLDLSINEGKIENVDILSKIPFKNKI